MFARIRDGSAFASSRTDVDAATRALREIESILARVSLLTSADIDDAQDQVDNLKAVAARTQVHVDRAFKQGEQAMERSLKTIANALRDKKDAPRPARESVEEAASHLRTLLLAAEAQTATPAMVKHMMMRAEQAVSVLGRLSLTEAEAEQHAKAWASDGAVRYKVDKAAAEKQLREAKEMAGDDARLV